MKTVKALRGRPWLIHAIASCSICDWRFEDYTKDVAGKAREHTRKTGHETSVETGYAQIYRASKGQRNE